MGLSQSLCKPSNCLFFWKELLTGDDLSDTERLIKGVTALVGLFALGQAGAAFKGASFLSKEALIYMGKTIAVDMAATTVSKVGTKYILKDGLGNTVMELDEVVETSYGKSTLKILNNTDNFTDNAIEHIFEGNVKRGNAGGYHYECIEDTAGKVISGTEVPISDLGVYKAQVEVNGIPKTANGGYSTFFQNRRM